MKKEEVPQDRAYLKEGKVRDLCYVVDEDGNYTTALSLGWSPKNDAIRNAWIDIEEKLREVTDRMKAGKTSPIEYYLVKNIMDTGMLAKYSGISKRKVKKHIKPEIFKTLPVQILTLYADVFKVSIEELKDPGPVNHHHKP